jgi:hypothetical protein
LVRVAAGLLAAVLILCGCWGEAPPSPPPAQTTRPQPVQTTRPPPERTPGRLSGEEVVGLCMMQSPGGHEFIPCGEAPRPRFRLRGKVIDAIPEPPDVFLGEPPTTVRSVCPSGTDVVRTLLPSGHVGVLCVDTVPSYSSTRS